jgi:hypothetical protein
MNFSMVPEKIKETVLIKLEGNVPDLVLRSATFSDGESGESYLFLCNKFLYIYTKHIGDLDYCEMAINLEDKDTRGYIDKENFKIFLRLCVPSASYTFIFSSFDEKDVATVVSNIVSPPPIPLGNVEESKKGNDEFHVFDNAIEILTAALMYLSVSDNEIASCEDKFITSIVNNNKLILQKVLKYFKTHSYQEFLRDASYLNQEQQLCILANLIELGFADGVLHKSEQRIIKEFSDYFGIEQENVDTIQQVIYLKNNISVLSD